MAEVGVELSLGPREDAELGRVGRVGRRGGIGHYGVDNHQHEGGIMFRIRINLFGLVS